MKSLDFGLCLVSALAIGVSVAGCGGLQPPIGASRAMSQSPIATHAAHDGTWMRPKAASQDLLYVATGDNLYVLSYPKGRLIGTLGITAYNICSNSKGDVFVPSAGYQIVEYAHNGKRIQTLQDGDVPLSCAVDPISGTLAVTNEGSGAGEVAIYANAQGSPQYYRDPDISTYGLSGYDNSGDLFVDGSGPENIVAELPRRTTIFKNYVLNSRFDAFDALQWDGTHMTMSNPSSFEIYRLRFGKSSLQVVGTTQIKGWHGRSTGRWPYVQTWLQGKSFIAQSTDLAELGLWSYPLGGNTRKVIGPFKSGTATIYGVTVSVAPKVPSR